MRDYGLAGFASLALSATVAQAQSVSGTWSVDAPGLFSSAGNWLNRTVPYGGTATFPAINPTPRNVILSTSVPLDGLSFAGTGGYTLVKDSASVASINLLPGVTGEAAPIRVLSGTHTINAPILGNTPIKKLGGGTLVLGGNNGFTGSTSVVEGVLRVTSPKALGAEFASNGVGVAFGGSLEIAGVDLGTRPLLLATSPAAAPNGAIRAIGPGTSAIGGPVYIAQSTAIGVDDPSGFLALGGELIDNGLPGNNTLTKVGPGTLTVRRLGGGAYGPDETPLPIGQLEIDGGLVRIAKGFGNPDSTSRLNALAIASGATLDLADTALVIEYTGESPAATLRADLRAGRLRGSGQSAGVRLGFGEAMSLGLSRFGGQDVDATTLVIKPVLAGDADLNGTVDFADLLTLAKSYNRAGNWTSGDFDYDGQVTFDDLLLLARNYRVSAGGVTDVELTRELEAGGIDVDVASVVSSALSGVQPAPEPAFSLTLAVIIGCRRRRG